MGYLCILEIASFKILDLKLYFSILVLKALEYDLRWFVKLHYTVLSTRLGTNQLSDCAERTVTLSQML